MDEHLLSSVTCLEQVVFQRPVYPEPSHDATSGIFLLEPVEESAPHSAFSAEEIILAQGRDSDCKSLKDQLYQGTAVPYEIDSHGILVRKTPDDQTRRMYVPRDLRAKVLRIAHYTKTAGHPGGSRMYATLCRVQYWHWMSVDVYNFVLNFTACVKERIQLLTHTSFLKLFPASRPF